VPIPITRYFYRISQQIEIFYNYSNIIKRKLCSSSTLLLFFHQKVIFFPIFVINYKNAWVQAFPFEPRQEKYIF